MAKKKSLEEMSAQELYELARAREQEELEREREARKAELEAARSERRQMLIRHRKERAELDMRQRKELEAIEQKIVELGGRVAGGRKKPAATGARGRVSKAVLEVLSDGKPHTTTEIKQALEKSGVEVRNVNQTLAYLKRQGRIRSPRRSTYTLA